MPQDQIRVDFTTIDGAAANMSTLQAAIEGHMADLDRSIAELQVWNGQAAAECQARNQEIKSAWASIQQQLGHMTTQTNRFNEDARITEDAIYRSFSSR
jgi:WXG100 family type VII secretion target